MSPTRFEYTDFDTPAHVLPGFHKETPMDAFWKREDRLREIKRQIDDGTYDVTGDQIAGGMLSGAAEERYSADGFPPPYCYRHSQHHQPDSLYCQNEERRREARQQEAEWKAQRGEATGAGRLTPKVKPMRIGRLRGGWLRQRHLERKLRQEQEQREISLGQMLFGVICMLIIMAVMMRIGYFSGRMDAIFGEGR